MNIQKSVSVLLLIALITIVGCMPGDGSYTAEEPAGFFWGVWHGLIAPISLIWGLFNAEIRLYEPQKTLAGLTTWDFISLLLAVSAVFSLRVVTNGRNKRTLTDRRALIPISNFQRRFECLE